MKFTNPEIIEGLSNKEYHSHGKDIISSSFVKNVCKHSVQEALDDMVDEESEPLIFGDLFHTLMEKDGFEKLQKRIYLWDDQKLIDQLTDEQWCQDNLGRGAYTNATMTNYYKKAQKEAKQEASEGQRIISPQKLDMMLKMKDRVMGHTKLSAMLKDAKTVEERSYFATEKESGIKVRIRPDMEILDILGNPLKMIDWKTCKDITRFSRDFFKYRYDIQAVFYADVSGIDPREFYFVAIEKRENPICGLFTLKESTIEKAYEDMELAWAQIVRYFETGEAVPENNLEKRV